VLVVVLVLVLDTERLKSFEDDHEDEDETANEFIGNCVDLAQFLFRSDRLSFGRRPCSYETTLE